MLKRYVSHSSSPDTSPQPCLPFVLVASKPGQQAFRDPSRTCFSLSAVAIERKSKPDRLKPVLLLRSPTANGSIFIAIVRNAGQTARLKAGATKAKSYTCVTLRDRTRPKWDA